MAPTVTLAARALPTGREVVPSTTLATCLLPPCAETAPLVDLATRTLPPCVEMTLIVATAARDLPPSTEVTLNIVLAAYTLPACAEVAPPIVLTTRTMPPSVEVPLTIILAACALPISTEVPPNNAVINRALPPCTEVAPLACLGTHTLPPYGVVPSTVSLAVCVMPPSVEVALPAHSTSLCMLKILTNSPQSHAKQRTSGSTDTSPSHPVPTSSADTTCTFLNFHVHSSLPLQGTWSPLFGGFQITAPVDLIIPPATCGVVVAANTSVLHSGGDVRPPLQAFMNYCDMPTTFQGMTITGPPPFPGFPSTARRATDTPQPRHASHVFSSFSPDTPSPLQGMRITGPPPFPGF
ncbi:uncharacterized protein LOC126278286 [Schistocerca gregaria]|uniref:uncharacterized protein LOC126278286 n=1 Tax=Schistocerca gregaria TaxID=7010 RepID=UPI00211E904A|nr:uncharacterized protein LOC126278286 [Schistocerca gregaria]